MHAMLIIHEFLCDGFLYLFMNFSNDRVEIVFILELKLLMMAAALIRGTFLQYFRETEEDLSFSP